MVSPINLCIVYKAWVLYSPGVFMEGQGARDWLGEVEVPKMLPKCVGAEPVILRMGEPHNKSMPGRGCFDQVKSQDRAS